MNANLTRFLAAFAARRVAGVALRRAGLLRFLPGGFLTLILTEGLLWGWRQARNNPQFRRRLWRSLSAGRSRRLPAR